PPLCLPLSPDERSLRPPQPPPRRSAPRLVPASAPARPRGSATRPRPRRGRPARASALELLAQAGLLHLPRRGARKLLGRAEDDARGHLVAGQALAAERRERLGRRARARPQLDGRHAHLAA